MRTLRALPSAAVWAALPIALAACGSEKTNAAPKEGPRAAAARPLSVTVAPVEARTVQRTVDTTGSLLPWEGVVLNTVVPGRVVRLRVDLGDRVEAGQILAELDAREYALGVEHAEAALRAARDGLARSRAQVEASRAGLQQVRDSRKSWEANLNRTRAALEEARLNLERFQQLMEEKAVAQREVDAARTGFEVALAQHQTAQVEMGQYPDRVRVAEAQLRSDLAGVDVAESEIKQREATLGIARKKLADAILRSPIRGAIAKRHVEPGQYLKEDAPVYTIVQNETLKYTGTVAEGAALQLRPGQAVRLHVDPVPGRTFEGQITRVSPAVDLTNRTVALEARVPNPDGQLKSGLFARGAVEVRQDAGVPFVPERAVSYFVGITKVFVVAEGVAQERTVRLGQKTGEWVEVLEGVRPGEAVATSGLAQLSDGAPVSVAAGEAK